MSLLSFVTHLYILLYPFLLQIFWSCHIVCTAVFRVIIIICHTFVYTSVPQNMCNKNGTEVYTNVWQIILMTRNTAHKLYDNSRICVTRIGTEVYTNVWQMIIMTRNTAVQTIWQLQNMCNKNGYRGIYKCVTDENNDTKYSRTNYMTTPEYV
jgi:hypothetical protein